MASLFMRFSLFYVLAVLGCALMIGERGAVAVERAGGTARTKSIEKTLGVISLNPDGPKQNSKIRLYNDDGSLWYEYSFYENKPASTEFEPFAFHPDYFLLVLKCVRRDATRFEVVVNESNGLTKFVSAHDTNVRFQRWGDHILGLFAVEFDRASNRVRHSPAGRTLAASLPKHVRFEPLAVKGDWLKIRWKSSKAAGRVSMTGWIKWRDEKYLLIEPFYFA